MRRWMRWAESDRPWPYSAEVEMDWMIGVVIGALIAAMIAVGCWADLW